MSKSSSWMRDDICWCMDRECPYTDCFRHIQNKRPETIYFTGSFLKGTISCPHVKEYPKVEAEKQGV